MEHEASSWFWGTGGRSTATTTTATSAAAATVGIIHTVHIDDGGDGGDGGAKGKSWHYVPVVITGLRTRNVFIERRRAML